MLRDPHKAEMFSTKKYQTKMYGINTKDYVTRIFFHVNVKSRPPCIRIISHRAMRCLRRVDLAFRLNLTFTMFIAIPFGGPPLCESFCGIIYLIWNKADYMRGCSVNSR